jgi:hypothetical protein
MPVIPATWEAEAGRSQIQGQSKLHSEMLWQKKYIYDSFLQPIFKTKWISLSLSLSLSLSFLLVNCE